MFANKKKTELCLTKLVYLGFIITPDCVEMDPKKVTAILEWPAPLNVTALRAFLGFPQFYRRHIKGYSEIVSPLTKLTSDKVPFIWGKNQQESFSALKRAVVTGPVLRIVDPHKPFFLETDASGIAVGAVLLQEGRPVAFESKKLSPSQRNWPTHEKELYTVVHALKAWRYYLYGAEFYVDVDHDILKYFCKQPDLSGRQARWAELMQEFNMMIRYRRGKENKVADALSRIVHNMSFTVLESALMTEIRETQKADEFVQSLWPKASVISPGKIDDLASRKGQVYARYTIEDGMLKRNGKVVVPNQNNLQQRVIHE